MRFALYLWRKTKLHKAWPKCQWTENRASMQLLWTIELDRTESMRYGFGCPVVAVGMSELPYQKKDKRYGMICGLLWIRSGRFIIDFYEWFSHIISSFTCHFIIWPDTTPMAVGIAIIDHSFHHCCKGRSILTPNCDVTRTRVNSVVTSSIFSTEYHL